MAVCKVQPFGVVVLVLFWLLGKCSIVVLCGVGGWGLFVNVNKMFLVVKGDYVM